MDHSTHIGSNGEATKVARTWHPMHLDAGYHEQEWGPHATPDHELIGTYRCVHHGVPMTVTVRHLKEGITGPEFEIEWADGMKVTVLDADTAVEYLLQDNAITVVPD